MGLGYNVVASALLWGGDPRLLLIAAREERFDLFTSAPILAELTDILSRCKFEKKIAASLLSIDQLVDRYAELALLVLPATMQRLAPDPDDDVVIATAIAARADFLVTGDRSLLSMKTFDGGRIISVAEAVENVRRF